jgi:hypothetical protein
MSLQDVQRSVHLPEYWDLDDADAKAVFEPFEHLPADQRRSPENAYELGLRVAEELGRLRLVVKALALERAPQPSAPPPRPRGRPPTNRLSVRANTERATVTAFGRRLSAAQAREVGSLLLQAANDIDGGSE